MIIKIEDKKIPFAFKQRTRIKKDTLLMLLVFGGLWVSMIAWIFNSWLDWFN